ncbi:MAG: cytochrome C oxidase subunit IV family protein [Planctomycetes bacterium]|nr:cytochrome C oxidase subunit IV family protein [Planctomycetota bacterium]
MSERHVDTPATYLVIFGVLMVLLVLTVAVAQFDLGPAGPVVAMGIAVAKAVLIVLYFMHLRHALSLVRVMAAAGFVWLAILLVLTMGDYVTRG